MRLRSDGGGSLLIVAGVVLALLAAVVTWRVATAARRTVRVLVAARDVPPLAQVAPGDVTLAAVPAPAVPSHALSQPRQAVGRFLAYGLLRGQVVRTADLATAGPGQGRFDARLTQMTGAAGSLRAVAVPLTRQEGLDLAVPGDHVDLLAVLHGALGQARLVASHVLVLDSAGTGPQPSRGPSGPRAVAAPAEQGVLVLALPVAQAERLALAEALGNVQILLDPLGPAAAEAAAPFTATQWALRAGGR